MKRLNILATLILILSFLMFGVAQAIIEKDSVKKKTDNRLQNIPPGDSTKIAGQASDGRQKKQRPQGYDDFVDKNGNGIDDRAEQKKDAFKKDTSPETPKPNSARTRKIDGNNNRLQRSPDDSVVKLKNR